MLGIERNILSTVLWGNQFNQTSTIIGNRRDLVAIDKLETDPTIVVDDVDRWTPSGKKRGEVKDPMRTHYI